METITTTAPHAIGNAPVRIVHRKGRTIAEYRCAGTRRGWLRMDLADAEQLLQQRAEQSITDVELMKRQARMGFAADMVRLPYVVRILVHDRIIYAVNCLREGLAAGHCYATACGGTAVVMKAL